MKRKGIPSSKGTVQAEVPSFMTTEAQDELWKLPIRAIIPWPLPDFLAHHKQQAIDTQNVPAYACITLLIQSLAEGDTENAIKAAYLLGSHTGLGVANSLFGKTIGKEENRRATQAKLRKEKAENNRNWILDYYRMMPARDKQSRNQAACKIARFLKTTADRAKEEGKQNILPTLKERRIRAILKEELGNG
jgi:hypothetical protein